MTSCRTGESTRCCWPFSLAAQVHSGVSEPTDELCCAVLRYSLQLQANRVQPRLCRMMLFTAFSVRHCDTWVVTSSQQSQRCTGSRISWFCLKSTTKTLGRRPFSTAPVFSSASLCSAGSGREDAAVLQGFRPKPSWKPGIDDAHSYVTADGIQTSFWP